MVFLSPTSAFCTTDSAENLLQALQNGHSINYAHSIPFHENQPFDLLNYFLELQLFGRHVAQKEFTDRCFAPDENIWAYVGKKPDASKHCKLRSKSTEIFFSKLFDTIKTNNPFTQINLTGWDLFHGHLFLIDDPKLMPDIGLIFHAKEFPKDYPLFKGQLDPRVGSTQSTNDPDYHLRNYLWLMSTNEIWLLNPKHADFPKELLSPYSEKFYTLDESCFFGQSLGVFYFFTDQNPQLWLRVH